MWKIIDTVLDRVFAVLGALLFSQGPAFIQQYMQNLSGRVEELSLQVNQIEKIAKSSGLSPHDYIQKFLTSGDSLYVNQGEFLQLIFQRFSSLQKSFISLDSAWWWTRPFKFLANIHTDIFSSTSHHFTPTVNLSVEGIVYALVGLLFGYVIYMGIKRIITDIWKGISRPFRRKKAEAKKDDTPPA